MCLINSLWIDGELKEPQLLTIKSFQAHGHEFVLWSYDTTSTCCEVRDARQYLPESEIFYYKNFSPDFKYGGIAERLKAELLYNLGGWHVDLDVVCLRHFDFEEPYVLRRHARGVVGNIIKAPKESVLASYYLNVTKTITADNTDWELSFRGLCDGVEKFQLQHWIVPDITFLRDDLDWQRFLTSAAEPDQNTFAFHTCGAMGLRWREGSYYDKLLRKYGIK